MAWMYLVTAKRERSQVTCFAYSATAGDAKADPVESSLLTPVFLGFPLHCRRVRVLELEPVPRSAAHVVRAETLADDAFETEPARVPEHDVPRPRDILGQFQAKLRAAQELREL